MGKSESVPEEKKNVLSANIYLYSSQKCFFFFCSGKKRSGGLCVGQSPRFLHAGVTLAGEDFAQTGFSTFPIHLARVEE